MNKDLYNYKAKLVRVIDGDTIEVLIDLGFDTSIKQIVRIARIDAPEKKSFYVKEKVAGNKVSDYLVKLLTDKQLYLTTSKGDAWDKYGRYLADVIVEDPDLAFNLSTHLTTIGFAHFYEGKKRDPWSQQELEQIINSEL